MILFFLLAAAANAAPNQWVQVAQDSAGGRRGSAIRYSPATEEFILWGFADHDPEHLQEVPLMALPEYDVVSFRTAEGRWRNHLPASREREWSTRLPLAFLPRTYSAITTGSERTVLRGLTDEANGVPRPDLNIVFDQVAWHPALRSLVYFTGGLTAAYDPAARRWSDLMPKHSPPPVVGGSLAWDPVNSEMVLFGGGHVAERNADGKIAGYTGTWVYGNGDWRQLSGPQPPPRMNSRLVLDAKNQVLVLFGGDGQSAWLSDTWLYDLRTRSWRQSRASANPPARAGHFAVFDPQTGYTWIGGGYNRRDLDDMWGYDAASDRWFAIAAKVPTGFYITGDIAPDKREIVLVTNTRRPDDRSNCNVLYPVRTTYTFAIDSKSLKKSDASVRHVSMEKREPFEAGPVRELPSMPPNQWVLLSSGANGVPVRTWGSATFDTVRGEILYWGGGHCGYGGSDVDMYDVARGQWRQAPAPPEFPERTWDKGVRLAGLTFEGAPWTDHGRRIYAYDPVSRQMIMARGIRLTAGYEPEALREFPAKRGAAPDAVVQSPSSYTRYATFGHDTTTGKWRLLGSAPAGVDTLVTTPRGVMAVNVDWPSTLNDAGYALPWNSGMTPRDTAAYLFEAEANSWRRIGDRQPSPQNLYEMTSLAFDTKRQRLVLHGAGANRNELWILDVGSGRWSNLQPKGEVPSASREAVYLPRQDVVLICGSAPEDRNLLAVWSWSPVQNAWRREPVSFSGAAPPRASGQNRAMVYDAQRDLVLLVLGTNEGRASVYGLRYQSSSQ